VVNEILKAAGWVLTAICLVICGVLSAGPIIICAMLVVAALMGKLN
jgi:hypothetical protein